MRIDFSYLAASLAALSSLPVRLYLGGQLAGHYHHAEFSPDPAQMEEAAILGNQGKVSYHLNENLLVYGLFRAPRAKAALIIGPVSQGRVGIATVHSLLRRMGESTARTGELADYFMSMPAYPLRNFLQILCTVNYFINGEKLDVSDLLLGSKAAAALELPPPREESPDMVVHNTLELEQNLLSMVENGRVEDLEKLFRQPVQGRSGVLASNALRQQKNLIICTATLVSRAAIRGGLDTQSAFALSDLYIQQAELLNNFEELTRLNARMVLDYASRVAQVDGLSRSNPHIRKARAFILGRISQPVTLAMLSRELGLNRTSLCALFTEQAGMTARAYVQSLKMAEARRLLATTDKTIAEIADFLGFSSQSHFQNVFRKSQKTTPMRYRKDASSKQLGIE